MKSRRFNAESILNQVNTKFEPNLNQIWIKCYLNHRFFIIFGRFFHQKPHFFSVLEIWRVVHRSSKMLTKKSIKNVSLLTSALCPHITSRQRLFMLVTQSPREKAASRKKQQEDLEHAVEHGVYVGENGEVRKIPGDENESMENVEPLRVKAGNGNDSVRGVEVSENVWKKLEKFEKSVKSKKKVKKKWKSEKSQKVKKNWGQNKKSILAVFDRFGRFRGGRKEEVTMPLNCGTYNLNCTPDFYADYISFHARPVLKIVRSSKQKLACDTPWYWKKNITGHSSPIWNLFNLFSSQTLDARNLCVTTNTRATRKRVLENSKKTWKRAVTATQQREYRNLEN